ncbi:MAG TPA: pitrilysin family protein [Anaerolineaceae bacterium]|jgi:zinc protease
MPNNITRKVLPNGLTVHLKEIHNAPIISHWVWYRVGSRNEKPGQTGISHWVEHMQFKGTPQFPPSLMDKAISRDGGFWNAMTSMDWTAYFETMPSDKIDLPMRLEADRMLNSTYDPEEVASERTVIISELEGDENEPMFRLSEAVQAEAFKQHSYHHETIGSKEDLHRIQRDDLYAHYRSAYNPQNAILAVAGDFDTNQMLARIEELYASIPGHPPELYTPPAEPPLGGERRLEVAGPGETVFLQLAYRSLNGSSPDFFAFTILDSLLTGPSGLSFMGGGGISNKTSRLYRALVECELAVSINGSLQATIDPYLYDITMTVHPRHTAEEILVTIDDEIKRLQDAPVPVEEIARASKQARALFAYGTENITNQAFWLGFAEIYAGYDWFLNYLDELEKITPQDVQRIAQTYLKPENRVIGIYRPTGEKEQQ